ncbi:uncharacterized protein Fot_36408 [Forsythia ovata]|uniref:Uncharacterized protein n=1 Tax=Forsythia ovata TaxID=205694 RepID=A0ABD1SPK5_9LAMI
MRPLLLVSLLLLSYLAQEAHGIRLRKGSPPAARHPIVHGESSVAVLRRNNNGVEEAIVCKGSHCSGRSRKLATKKLPNSSTTAIVKNDENEENRDDSKSEGYSISENKPESVADILDIAGMDYSQATRKSPIHN